MAFCPSCGQPLLPSISFCPKCGFDLREMMPQATSQISMKAKGAILEDSIADYFRHLGFDIESRVKMKDRFDVSHEIDVLASKTEPFGTIRVAVECKNVESSIDIKEVRNFHDKLSALGITKGIFISTGGFTLDAESHAKALGIELWDMRTLRTKLAISYESHEEAPENDVTHDALAFDATVLSGIRPTHLRNSNSLSETIQLQYKPYYFLDFRCFSQQRVRGTSIVLDAKGTLVLDGISGQFADWKVTISGGGSSETTVRGSHYVECSRLPTQTITSADLPAKLLLSAVGAKVDSTSAKNAARMELVKRLGVRLSYHTTRSRGAKIVKPRPKEIDILDIRSVKIPLLTATYRLKNHSYIRTILAATGKFTLDQTSSCMECTARPIFACENCGAIICETHMKTCSVCAKSLCTNCVISKGIISKTLYCPEHQPKQ